VHKFHKCTYIRQYHNLRPFIKVTSIPEFDPTKLPYWDIYIKEKKAKSIIVGGTIAGQFMSGLSGGQRKILLFELICQRVANQENLLIVLDEPFSGVTDDFMPYIIERLNQLRIENNILLVTNDHVDALKKLADNTITVSAIDRSTVSVNRKQGIDRELALLAMSIGDEYSRSDRRSQDIKFFVNVELSKYGGLWHSLALCIFGFSLFLATYWDSRPGSEPFVLVSSGLVGFFSLLPLGLSIVDSSLAMEGMIMVTAMIELLHQLEPRGGFGSKHYGSYIKSYDTRIMSLLCLSKHNTSKCISSGNGKNRGVVMVVSTMVVIISYDTRIMSLLCLSKLKGSESLLPQSSYSTIKLLVVLLLCDNLPTMLPCFLYIGQIRQMLFYPVFEVDSRVTIS